MEFHRFQTLHVGTPNATVESILLLSFAPLCHSPAWSHFARCIDMLQSSHLPDCIICVLLQINNRGGNFANCTWPNGSCPQHLKMQPVKHFAATAVKQEHNNVKVFLPCSIINGKAANCFGLKDCLIFQLLLASTLNILVWVPKNCNFQSFYSYNGIVFRGIAIIIESQMQYLTTYHWHKNMVKQCHWPHFKQSHVVLKSPKANMISCQNLSTVAIVSRVLTIG